MNWLWIILAVAVAAYFLIPAVKATVNGWIGIKPDAPKPKPPAKPPTPPAAVP